MSIAVLRVFVFLLLIALVSTKGWDIGSGFTYDMKTSILLGEAHQFQSKNGSTDDVGFQLTAKLKVIPLWKNPNNPETILISVKIVSLQLWIKSRKAPKPEGFIEHSSRLVDIPKDPILLLWNNGQILNAYAISTESLSSLNLKRGIASIFQYKTTDGIFQEKDASGLCNVTYNSLTPRSFKKTKLFCKRNKNEHPNLFLGVQHNSIYTIKYGLTEALLPREIFENEKHETSLTARPEAGTSVTANRVFQLLPGVSKENRIIASTFTEAINKFDPRYVEISIEAENEYIACPESGCLTLDAVLDNSRSALEESALGKAKSASAFLKIVPLLRVASVESLVKILKSPRNHDILPQLYDLYGSASTFAAHQAAFKILRQDDIGDNTERYLWALSTSPYPNTDIINDIIKRSEETIQNDKVAETLTLTAAIMAKRHGAPNVIEKVKKSLELGLHSCTGEECKVKFLRSLGSLGTKSVIPILLKYSTNSTRTLSVIAWKAIGSLYNNYITAEIRNLAMKTFLQLNGQKVDSTVRTLSLNVILESNPSVEDLQQLLLYLTHEDPMFEVKKYLVQRLQQLISTSSQFRETFKKASKNEFTKLVNYNTFSQRGLSTAFTRSFLESAGSNGSLVTIQEINSGLLKRGIVDVVLLSDSYKYTFFSLGLFAGGLSNFVNSNDQEENDNLVENEVATAGMEISFLGVNIRPFVFFSGQGELMGHVWSGTASERTPAFQTIVNLHRHREIIALGSGFVVETDIEGAISVDLAGQIKLSLWSRNAQSLVEIEAGISIQGNTKIITNFVQSRTEFTLTLEPKLELATDVDFSGPVSLCMRLGQPQNMIKHHIYKVERIPGSRHKLRKTRRITILSTNRSYLLNTKNNEMCSKVFN
jgi:microsomal triglyceride transfer protein large subunit